MAEVLTGVCGGGGGRDRGAEFCSNCLQSKVPSPVCHTTAASEWFCCFSDANGLIPGSAAFPKGQPRRADLPRHMCRASEGWARGSAFPQRKAAGLDGL